MSKSSRLLLFTIFISIISGCKNESVISVYDLRCENLSNPLGIATAAPWLSWKISSAENGTYQVAYQIIAASKSGLLDENKADLWNSGKITSAESIMIPYQGKKITSGSLCYWKVRIWNEKNELSGWSVPACFSIGLLDKNDWKAYYIGLTGNSENCISPQLRKTFTATEKVAKALLYVNSLGYHEVWINGNKAGKNVLVPAVSQFSKRSLSVTYDVSSLIRKGTNDLVLWIGQGWYSKGLPGVDFKSPLVKAQLECLIGSEWKILCSTDSSWTGRESGYSTIGSWRPGKFGGEQIDGSHILTDLSASSLDKVEWEPVETPEITDYAVTPQVAESNIIIESFKPDTIYRYNDSTWLVDVGKTLTGWFEIHFPQLYNGQKIVMEFCDHLDKDGKTVNQGQTDIYIASGQGKEIFCNKFNYHGFRFVKISNLKDKPLKNSINAYLIHTDYSYASSFECSDNDLNEIQDMINYTIKCLSLGGYLVDCPQIERLGYGGDGNASTETAQTMFDLAPLYANWLQAWADCIREDGGLPHTAPNPYSAGGGPYWCGFIIIASWKSYINYGDIRFLERNYPVMLHWLGYVEKYSSDNLLRPWPETEYRSWYLGDWATPEGVDQTESSSIDLVNNCFISVCYETMGKIARVLGKNDDTEKFERKRKLITESINKEFLNKSKKIYGSGSQIDLSYPLLAGVVPDSIVQFVTKNLLDVIKIKNRGHIGCGLVGIPVFTEWAVKNYQPDLVYSILKKKEYPGYLYMIDNEATTTWEHWNGARSRIHNCYNGIGSWFYQALGGIRTDENLPGYRHIIIDPQIPYGVNWVNISKETPYGHLAVKWQKEENDLKIELKIPVGCTASVKIHEGNKAYTLNGRSYQAKSPYAEVGSGDHVFTYKWNNKVQSFR